MVRGPMKSSFGAVVFAVAVLSLAGCGSSGNSLDAFLGIWQFTQSSVTEECTNVPAAALTVTWLNQEMKEGITSDLVSPALFSPTCDFKFDVDGKNANMPMQRCNLDDAGIDYYEPVTWRFTLLADTQAEEVGSLRGKITFIIDAAGTEMQLDCTLTLSGKLDKVAKN